MGETKYTYWGIAYLAAAFILVALGAYLTWGRGEYSGYKCTDGVVTELYPFECYSEDGVIGTDFAAKIEYVTDEGEKRIPELTVKASDNITGLEKNQYVTYEWKIYNDKENNINKLKK